MKLIESKAELYNQELFDMEGVFKQIEKCARVSYKSEDKITDTSSKEFIDRLIRAGHYAPLEFGAIYLNVFPEDDFGEEVIRFFFDNPYSICQRIMQRNLGYVITTNLRVIVENHLEEALKYLCEPTEYHHKRYCVKFTTDIGVAREFTRHRVFSFMQESTRYCNYSKDKFGGEITFIKPSWFKESQISTNLDVAQSPDTNGAVFYERPYKAYWVDTDAEGFDWYREDFFIHSCQVAEKCYLLSLEEGLLPQEARQVLPLATKTELVMCGFEDDWEHFWDLRMRGTTGAPHPDAKKLATEAYNLLYYDRPESK